MNNARAFDLRIQFNRNVVFPCPGAAMMMPQLPPRGVMIFDSFSNGMGAGLVFAACHTSCVACEAHLMTHPLLLAVAALPPRRAWTAPSVSVVRVHVKRLFREAMPMLAVRLLAGSNHSLAGDVLFDCDWLDVVRVHTCPVEAKVVEN